MLNPYLKQYHKNEIETATPEKILLLLYDGAVQYLTKAKAALEQNDIPTMHNNIMKCENIILEFINSLNMELGGDLAKNLKALYQYLYDTLVSANLTKDMKKIEEVLKHITELRETWRKAVVLSNAEKKTQMVEKEASGEDEYEEDEDVAQYRA